MKLAYVTINNGTRTIGNCAFEQSAITNLIIPDSVTTIGHMAFSECHNLTSISISDSVTSISEKAFFGAKVSKVYSIKEAKRVSKN